VAIDFDRIAQAALANAEGLLCELFPAGRRDGYEFRVGGLTGEAGRSLAINMRTGKWADFSGGDTGSDLIALWAAARMIGMGTAARELDERLSAGGITAKALRADSRPNRTDPSDWEALPFSPDEQPAPTFKRLFRENEWREYPIIASWCYRDAQGRLVGYVCRVQFSDGSKDVFPFTYARHTSGREQWRWKGFARPRPLYRLPELVVTASEVGVLIVEGEKSADAAARLLPNVAVVTWPGGSKAVSLVDLEPLRGRRVTLWPDADKPGLDAMAAIADRLEGVAASTFIVLPPEGVCEGWDLADAEAEGWDAAKVRAHVKARKDAAQAATQNNVFAASTPTADTSKNADKLEASHDSDELPEDPSESIHDAPPPSPLEDIRPFRCLGFADGRFFYLPNGSKQIVELTASEHKKLPLLQLATLQWWQSMFAGKEDADWGLAANALIQWQIKVGIFDPKRIRGRGAWIDAGRVVFHAGDRLLIEGSDVGIHEHPSPFIYEQAHGLEPESAAPASNTDAAKLITLCESVSWKHPLNAKLLAGWCVIAPICGVLHWRPHIWINGPRGTGKTWILENIIQPIAGRAALQVQSATTEPGIRQALRSDALPIIFDEAESENRRGQERMQSILEFARACSSDTEAIIAKGTASGGGMRFKPRACICFASIGVAAVQAADTSRIAALELKRRGSDFQSAFDKTLAIWGDTVGREGYVESLRARSLSLAPVIRANSKTFARVVAKRLGDARLGDQIGALLSGAYSLTSRNEIAIEDATEWVQRQDWSFFEPDESDTDQVRAFTMLVDAHVRIERDDGPAITRTVGELVEDAMSPASDQTTARAILMRHGLRIMEDGLSVAVANGHQFLAKVFSDSAWAGKHRDQMARIPGAKASIGAVSFGPGSKHRAVLLPLTQFTD
jgi:putative DNA primase/helicase